jgi:hypothetical protein
LESTNMLTACRALLLLGKPLLHVMYMTTMTTSLTPSIQALDNLMAANNTRSMSNELV